MKLVSSTGKGAYTHNLYKGKRRRQNLLKACLWKPSKIQCFFKDFSKTLEDRSSGPFWIDPGFFSPFVFSFFPFWEPDLSRLKHSKATTYTEDSRKSQHIPRKRCGLSKGLRRPYVYPSADFPHRDTPHSNFKTKQIKGEIWVLH